MKKRFYLCDPMDSRSTQCVFTEDSLRRRAEHSRDGMPRCIRHGALICLTTWQYTLEDARKYVKGDRDAS